MRTAACFRVQLKKGLAPGDSPLCQRTSKNGKDGQDPLVRLQAHCILVDRL